MNQDLQFAYKVNQIALQLNHEADVLLLQHFDTTYQQFLIMGLTSQLGNCSQRQLAEGTLLTSAGVAHNLAELDRRGWISKKPSATSKREVVIAITPSGSKVLKSMHDILEQSLKNRLPQPLLAKLNKQLDTILKNICN